MLGFVFYVGMKWVLGGNKWEILTVDAKKLFNENVLFELFVFRSCGFFLFLEPHIRLTVCGLI